MHDFKMYKEVVGATVLEGIRFLADSGFHGILAFHKNSEIPKKKSKYHPLSVTEKVENRRISQERIFVENVIAKFKVFKILSNKYRNRRKRYGLRMSLICGIYNAELRKR
ncbi:MAG: hypothetical protein LBE76_01580 [Nitrososphaerota archaeon]|nr:hypothetical protein [Nitrososphaerota archaeon]